MQDETKADGRFKIADVDVNTLFDFGPAEQNRAALYVQWRHRDEKRFRNGSVYG